MAPGPRCNHAAELRWSPGLDLASQASLEAPRGRHCDCRVGKSASEAPNPPRSRQHGLARHHCSRVAESRKVLTWEFPRTLVQLPT